MEDSSLLHSDPQQELLAHRMMRELARLITDRVQTNNQSTFVARTGVNRNRITRIKEKMYDDTIGEEIRFSIGELSRIANELQFASLNTMIEYIEYKALNEIDYLSRETTQRRKALELAALFMKLSDHELDVISEAIKLVSKPVIGNRGITN